MTSTTYLDSHSIEDDDNSEIYYTEWDWQEENGDIAREQVRTGIDRYPFDLPPLAQTRLKVALRDALKQEGVEGLEFEQAMGNAWNSRLSSLKDTIDLTAVGF